MRLFGYDLKIQRAKAPSGPSSSWQLRSNDGQGNYTQFFQNYVPRKVDPNFYEFLREGIPIFDAAINRLVSLDGHIVVKGHNEKLVEEIKDWIYNVPVNDIQMGLQAYHQNLTAEAHEQGFALGEFVTDSGRTDIVGLRVGDSKFIKFKRIPTGLEIYQRADGDPDYRLLNQTNLQYFSINNENQNPYGTALARSCEFVAKILVTMDNSLMNLWERFGDPSYSIIYKTSKRDGVDLEARRKKMSDEFEAATRVKRMGKSADFIRAIDKDSDIEISVIGAQGQIMDFEVPARHVLEQIVAKTGLPPWMLGLHWSTTERLSNAEAEMLLADVSTRQAAKMPLFHNLVKNLLLLRGRTWKKGDWWLEWEQVNLHDIEAQARARFMNTQADMYQVQIAQQLGTPIAISDLSIGKSLGAAEGVVQGQKLLLLLNQQNKCKGGCGCGGHKSSTHGISGSKESRPQAWPELDQVEQKYLDQLTGDWADLQGKIMEILNLSPATGKSFEKSGNGDQPALTAEEIAAIMAALSAFISIYDWQQNSGIIRKVYGESYSLGLTLAAKYMGGERPILDLIKNREIYDQLCKAGFELVKDNATVAIKDRILAEIQAQAIAGSNPVQIAGQLEKLFNDQNANWERLVRTELTMAAELAKKNEWKAWGLKTQEFYPAPDACSFCLELAGDYPIEECPVPGRDTHPRCRCSTRPSASEVNS